jgi:hypothetical protein
MTSSPIDDEKYAGWRAELRRAYPWLQTDPSPLVGRLHLVVSLVRRLDEIIKRRALTVRVTRINDADGRLYIDGEGLDSECDALIARATALSASICEVCGRPGRVRETTSGMMMCVCSECDAAITDWWT